MDSSGLQVNLGTFDTRKLEEFLNPMLLAFVDRLNLGRSLAFCSSSSFSYSIDLILKNLLSSLYSMVPMVDEKDMLYKLYIYIHITYLLYMRYTRIDGILIGHMLVDQWNSGRSMYF